MLYCCSKIVLYVVILLACCSVSHAYTPKSPEVQSMVEDGLAYIEQNFGKHGLDKELGGYAVCAIAAYSHTGDENHPLVRAAIEEIRDGLKNGLPTGSHANYSLGLALVLLGTLDATSYPQEVQAILDEIYERQLASGTWTYPNDEIGDTSQSQYACLGMWMAHRQGFQIRIPNVVNAANWFLRTQAPDGGFGYRPRDPGSFVRVEQERKTPSMGVAGAAGLYVTGEPLGFIDDSTEMRARIFLPPAITQASTDRNEVATGVDSVRWHHAVGTADEWCRRHALIENPFQQYYYMYTVERYWAFRELAMQQREEEPRWYNDGVRYLQSKVSPDGSWKSDNGPTIGTAFAMLFLLRSSQATVERIERETGVLSGGSSLPGDLAELTTDANGRVVRSGYGKKLDDFLKALADQDAPLDENISIFLPETLVLSENPQTRPRQLSSLRRMVTNGPYQARLTAANTLGTVRDLASVPALIFALSDPDWRVAKAARDALRFISRNPAGFGLEIESEAPTKDQWTKAQKQWSEWLLSVQPDAELIE